MKLKKIKNYFFVVLGSLTLILGVIGIVLPILPTTPFLLLTLIFYTKGSEKFRNWFISTKIYKKHLDPFIKTRAMTNANKFKVLFMVTGLIMIPIIMVDVLAMRIVLGLVILGHYLYFLLRVKSVSHQELILMLEEIEKRKHFKG